METPVIMVDVSSATQYKQFELAIQNSVGIFSDKISANGIHFISSDDINEVNFLFESPIFGHYICRNYGDPLAAAKRYGYIVRATQKERAFGMKNLIHENTKIQTVIFQNTHQKQEGVEAVRNFLLSAKFKSRMAMTIANAVDELVMNAMFDAPVDELGTQIYSSTPRSTKIKLEGQNSVEMHVGYDGEYVAISAVDLWGSLVKLRLFSHITKRYIDEEYKVKTTVAGAGIGLATVFRSGGSFFFSSESQSRTEVTVFFKRTDNFKEFRNQFRFISTQFYF